MDLVSWSFNAIDKIFSTMRMGEGAPGCPSGTEPAGYIMDSWKQWNLICLSQLSVEDSEDVWIFIVLVSGFLLFGLTVYLAYRKINKPSRNIGSIPELRDGMPSSSSSAYLGAGRGGSIPIRELQTVLPPATSTSSSVRTPRRSRTRLEM